MHIQALLNALEKLASLSGIFFVPVEVDKDVAAGVLHGEENTRDGCFRLFEGLDGIQVGVESWDVHQIRVVQIVATDLRRGEHE